MKHLVVGIWVSLVTVLSSLGESQDKPNILFLITDDQFKDFMNWYPEGEGKNLTPHTDKLAAEATVMMRQYVTSPVCTPSRYACLSGLYPSRSKSPDFLQEMKSSGGQSVVQWNTFITDEPHTVARKLDEAGYLTGFVGKNHVFTAEGWKKPQWDANPSDPETKALLQMNNQVQVTRAKELGFDYAASLYYNNPVENGIEALASHNLDWIAEGALDFFDKAKEGEEPFFLYLATTIPHGPTEPKRSWQADRRVTSLGLREEPLTLLPSSEELGQRVAEADVWDYNRENLLWLDEMVGAVLDRLEENGQLDNTLIVYFNDHGQKSKGTVYEGGVHGESFFWRKGGFPVGSRCAVPVSNVDFAPTLLDFAGVDYEPSSYDGRSFKSVLEGEEGEKDRSLYFELGYVRGVLKGDWKYIALRYPEMATEMTREERQRRLDQFNEGQKQKGRPVYTEDPMHRFSHVSLIPGGGDAEHMSMGKYPAFYERDQLYYLPEDPDEKRNLAGDVKNEEKLAEMKAELKKHLANLPGTFGELKTKNKE